MRKIVIASTGGTTFMCIDGKVYGEQIEKIEFSHTGGEEARIKVVANDIPLKCEEVGDGFRNFINSLLDTAPKDIKEQCIEKAFKVKLV